MDKKKIEEMKKRVDRNAVVSILNVCKLHGIIYLDLPEPVRKTLIEVYQAGGVDALKEVRSDVVYNYSWQQGVKDGALIEVFKNQWPELTHGRPILATRGVFIEFSLAALLEIYNKYVVFKGEQREEPEEFFSTMMNGQSVLVADDSDVITILFPDEY